MDLRDLRYFAAIAEAGHLHRAADRVGRSQPALSKCIRRLEEELGAKLFERAGRNIRLTSVGEALVVRANSLCRSLDDVAREMALIASGDIGQVRIGAGPTTADNFIAEAFQRLLRGSDRLTYRVVIGMTDVLRKMLRADEIDLIFGPLAPGDRNEFASARLARDHVVVAASKRHELAGRRVRMADLTSYNWLLPAESVSSRQWLNRKFESHGLLRPRVQIETNSVVMMKRTVATSNLLTFMSRSDLQHASDEPALTEIHLPETTMQRDIGVLYVRDRYVAPAVAQVIELITATAR